MININGVSIDVEAHQNKVALVRWAGGDMSHAEAAWASTGMEIGPEKVARIPAFLAQLAKAGHYTPFEHSMLTFKFTAEIATHIQCIKHRIGCSINSESARYKELKDDRYYIPNDWPVAAMIKYVAIMEASLRAYHELVEELVKGGVDRKRAKESARFVRPYGTQISWFQTMNFRSLMHFMGLRNDEHAQKEIRDMARSMFEQVGVTGAFGWSLAAFGGGSVEKTVAELETPRPGGDGLTKP